MPGQTVESVEQVLRDELVRGDALIAATRPILRHLLAHDDDALFSDEIVARVRGMMLDLARQLLTAQAEAAEIADCPRFVAERQDELAQAMFEDAAFLSHVHALSLEAQLTERLQARSGIDAVLSPLVRELAATDDPVTAGLAMAVLAAQARFVQQHRRMELPLGELPGDLFHKGLLFMRSQAGAGDERAEQAERRLRGEYEEGAGRLALLSHLIMGLGSGTAGALAVDHAGLALFATALAAASGQERPLTLLSFADRQFGRLALSLRAAGLAQLAVEQQFLFLHPEAALPDGFEMLPTDRATAVLSASQPEAAF